MEQKIFIIGARGNIGSNLVKQIIEKGDSNSKIHKNPTIIVGASDISNYIYDSNGLDEEKLMRFLKNKEEGDKYSNLIELIDNIAEETIFVDVTASKAILDVHKHIIDNTNHSIVTANKNPACFCDSKTFKNLTRDVSRYGYRCSVMAGADVVSFIQDLADVDDLPIKMEGCFSGTLGFITSELEKEINFSEIVKEAHNKGYTEPHPKDDLNGLDVARKLLILARSCGHDLELEDVKVQPFIPEEYFDYNVEEFLDKMQELDLTFSKKVSDAKKENKVLRYVATMTLKNNKPILVVELKEVSKDDSLGSLKGTMNKIVIITKNGYPKEAYYAIEAPGAGLIVTPQNLRRDLLYRLKNREMVNKKIN